MRGRALVLLGLASIAVTQPVLDLFGRNPEFFVVGRYSRWQIVVFALGVALVPALVATALVALADRVNRRAGDIVFALAVAVFGAAIVLAILRSAGVDSLPVVVALALAGAVARQRLGPAHRTGRMLVTFLAASSVLFVGLFAFASPASSLVLAGRSADAGRVELDRPDGPGRVDHPRRVPAGLDPRRRR